MSDTNAKRVVLAYSGGLDTSVILKWLIEQGYEVICFVGDVGQQDDFEAVRRTALAVGASKVYVEDLKRELVTDYIFPSIRSNAIYEGRYLLGTAVARPILAARQIEIAAREGAACVSHGATGKGNDQVRFELCYYALAPEITVLSPWKDRTFLDQFQGRGDLLAYAEKHNLPVKASRAKPYSEDANLMHVSHEAGILEDPAFPCPEDVFSYSVSPKDAPDAETILDLHFKDGTPTLVRDITRPDAVVEHSDPLDLFTYLCKVGGDNGVGRVDMVENRFVGIKSRGVYETPGGAILREAHMDLEAIAMDREVMRLRNMLSPKIAELMYDGFWFSPEMEFLMDFLDMERGLETLATTRPLLRNLRALLAKYGVEIEKRVYTRADLQALCGDALDLDRLESLQFDRIEDRMCGLVPHHFKILCCQRPDGR